MGLAALILGGPWAAFALLGLVPPLRRGRRSAAGVSIAGIAVSFAASTALLAQFLSDPTPRRFSFLWAPLGSTPIEFGVLLDGLSVPMLALVALVALVVQVYSLGYMARERPASLGRYYTWHSLFAGAMLGLVAAHNTLQTYVFWELVGLGSYLLIGFWYEKPAAGRAAMKAFWTTRLGDVGFALGVVLLWAAGGSFLFEDLFHAADRGTLSGPLLTFGVAGLFVGAMGKSAQFPLHVWLPDAMEGPTPVSALIHAATMVAAGVYLMVRIAPLLAHAPAVAAVALALGVLTAVLAATMALVERDVKRILAFSTVSQLGTMMAAVGAGAGVASFFHLTTHAFFKALLFLAAGSLIHAVHSNDIFAMGRLARRMPWTCAYFLIGSLALAGVWPLSGFFSKDEILIALWNGGHPLAAGLLVVTTGLTAFYMFRAFFVAFFGEREAHGKAHESPWVMLGPMGVLAVGAVLGGLAAGPLRRLLEASISPSTGEHAVHQAAVPVPVLGLLAAGLGVFVAWLGYQAQRFDPGELARTARPLTVLLERRYYVDEAFVALYRLLYLRFSMLVGWIDRFLVDGLVNFVSWLAWEAATRLRAVHTGRVQDALYAVALGALLLGLLAAGS